MNLSSKIHIFIFPFWWIAETYVDIWNLLTSCFASHLILYFVCFVVSLTSFWFWLLLLYQHMQRLCWVCHMRFSKYLSLEAPTSVWLHRRKFHCVQRPRYYAFCTDIYTVVTCVGMWITSELNWTCETCSLGEFSDLTEIAWLQLSDLGFIY